MPANPILPSDDEEQQKRLGPGAGGPNPAGGGSDQTPPIGLGAGGPNPSTGGGDTQAPLGLGAGGPNPTTGGATQADTGGNAADPYGGMVPGLFNAIQSGRGNANPGINPAGATPGGGRRSRRGPNASSSSASCSWTSGRSPGPRSRIIGRVPGGTSDPHRYFP